MLVYKLLLVRVESGLGMVKWCKWVCLWGVGMCISSILQGTEILV